ncbi:uncharacterized protein LOC110901045 [Helianthus annuus]|uniref:uncharacterized protein LOC110901045 n=1 Tax=Helianthus annuus TaxID=4232 RepID=UPI0016533867|nr:uncharacterized protein LOC110901045 [Helianthus annuus]
MRTRRKSQRIAGKWKSRFVNKAEDPIICSDDEETDKMKKGDIQIIDHEKATHAFGEDRRKKQFILERAEYFRRLKEKWRKEESGHKNKEGERANASVNEEFNKSYDDGNSTRKNQKCETSNEGDNNEETENKGKCAGEGDTTNKRTVASDAGEMKDDKGDKRNRVLDDLFKYKTRHSKKEDKRKKLKSVKRRRGKKIISCPGLGRERHQRSCAKLLRR